MILTAHPAAKSARDRNGHTPTKILHHTQMWKDRKTKQNWQRILNVLATETEREGIKAQLEIMQEEAIGPRDKGSEASTVSTAVIPENVELSSRTGLDSAASSSLGNPSSSWAASSESTA